ncbi:uncharacterized protein LOC128133460 [Lactuca sativa]|uniref:uncharacterized protein LOC128133460 n=1 Tax=Lactuca sativa TaxID=4236 RepID=UPI0022AFC0EB|nr:uncharacterized protein LOC128133460 [Lactuca sativa]
MVTLRNGRETGESSTKEASKEDDGEALPSQEMMVKSKVQGENPRMVTPVAIPPPFPPPPPPTCPFNEERGILDILRKVEVNILLLDAIKQIPRYAKFLKELCTKKRNLQGHEKISMSENVSAILQRELPPKCKDPGMFTVPCNIGDVTFSSSMLDLGASINVIPYSTARTKIDVYLGNLIMEFDDEPLTPNFYEFTNHELLEMSLSKGRNQRSIKGEMKHHPSKPEIDEVVDKLDTGQLRTHERLQIQGLKELKTKAYENVKVYKKEVKTFHNKSLTWKHFKPVQKVLLYRS